MKFNEIYNICKPYTLTSLERMKSLYDSVFSINKEFILGDFVECGVYKGGSVMNMALSQLNFQRRIKIHLYDTFEGMTKPEDVDKDLYGVFAKELMKDRHFKCFCPIESVEKNLSITEYPKDLFIYHKGDVAITLKNKTPEFISILRLDTDWYASTKLELEILYPKISKGGFLIVDDYGHFDGARKAADEYFKNIDIDPKFEKIDYTGVLHKKG